MMTKLPMRRSGNGERELEGRCRFLASPVLVANGAAKLEESTDDNSIDAIVRHDQPESDSADLQESTSSTDGIAEFDEPE